jgi:hypothetical protein
MAVVTDWFAAMTAGAFTLSVPIWSPFWSKKITVTSLPSTDSSWLVALLNVTSGNKFPITGALVMKQDAVNPDPLVAGGEDGGADELPPIDVPAASPCCWAPVQFPATRHPLRPAGLVMPLAAATCCCCAAVQVPDFRHAAAGGGDAPG